METEWSYKARYTLNPTGKLDHMLVDGRGTITLAHLVNAEHKGRRGQEKQNIKKNAGSGKGENGLVTYEATKAITKGTQLITVYGGTHMRGDGFKEPPEGQKIRGAGDWVRNGTVWREEDVGDEEGREPIRKGSNTKPIEGDGADTRNKRKNEGCSMDTSEEEEQIGSGKQGDGVTGVPRGVQQQKEGSTVTKQNAQERGSGNEVNDGDVEGAAGVVEGRRLLDEAEYPTVEELIEEDYEDQTEERRDEQDETMEEGEEEGRPSKADDGTANAVMQDEGRKRKRRTWKMSEMREVTRAKMLERMEMSADDATMQRIRKTNGRGSSDNVRQAEECSDRGIT